MDSQYQFLKGKDIHGVDVIFFDPAIHVSLNCPDLISVPSLAQFA